VEDVDEEDAEYSVISFNEVGVFTYRGYDTVEPIIELGTASGSEMMRLTGASPPHRTRYRHPDYGSTRRDDVTEKCMFCAHRVAQGKLPACVEACPSEARIFGDLDDPTSAPSKALKNQKSFRLKEKAGTKPNVHYIGQYASRKNA
jgi:Fe-S-cluster-containing hydrogenase component 2